MNGVRPLASISSKIRILVSGGRASTNDHAGLFSGWQWEVLRGMLLRHGVTPELVPISSISDDLTELHRGDFNVTLSMGERSLALMTGKSSIDKWHLSPLDAVAESTCRKVIPTFDFKRLQIQPELSVYMEMAVRRAAEEANSPAFDRVPERFRLNPPLHETLAVLRTLKGASKIAVDVETGNGQINTVGFAWSESDAIAINVLPDRLADDNYFELWGAIRDVLESESEKIFQNFIYDTSYFSAYGVRVRGSIFDTMWAQKFLWPELEMGLDNVGRIYTRRPYWKDDGKVTSEEGKRKDWGNVRDWERHYLYNCRDTTGTFGASTNQRTDLVARGLDRLWESFIGRFTGPITEMCANGIPFDPNRRDALQKEVTGKIEELTKALPEGLNPRSPKQVMDCIRSRGYKIPKKFDGASKSYKESVNEKSLKKLRLKHPEEALFPALIELSHLNKAKSAYLEFATRPGESTLRYSLCGVGTETGRWSGGKDAFGNGFNIQTIPTGGKGLDLKQIFVAPAGWQFLECDLRQAESRFVAYDSADSVLIRMLEDPTQDIHRYVAAEIFQCRETEITKQRRQLGKKSGHAANYCVKENTLIDSCLAEMDLVLNRKEANNVLESYHRLFPGIRRWHAQIRDELRRSRKLTTPMGRERYFYGRFGEDMFREAYAYRPQSTIPDVTNSLMLHLWEQRQAGTLPTFKFLVQVHDSLLFLVPDANVEEISRVCLDTTAWHPKIELSGGRLIIPTEVKAGRVLSEVKEIKEGKL